MKVKGMGFGQATNATPQSITPIPKSWTNVQVSGDACRASWSVLGIFLSLDSKASDMME